MHNLNDVTHVRVRRAAKEEEEEEEEKVVVVAVERDEKGWSQGVSERSLG